MKLMMGIVILTLFADNLTRQGQTSKRTRKRFGLPRLGRQRLYDRVIKKILPLDPEKVRERRAS
jgi:hypothetical protein